MDISWLWAHGGGASLFDPYSLYHIVFFIAITLMFYSLFKKQTWAVVLAISFIWETWEYWINAHLPWFPYVGSEGILNKCVGDPISNFDWIFGCIAAWRNGASICR